MKNLMDRAYTELFLWREKTRELLRKKDGVTLIEYSLLIALITALVIASILTISGKVQAAWQALVDAWT